MQNEYSGTWESVKKHKIPEWYHDCKFGIFIHWGLYSVPAYAPKTCELGEIPTDEEWFCNNPYAEWYYNSVNVGKGPSYEHHMKTYGKDFPYSDFAPMWKAEKWNPEEWADLFREAGAGYVVLVTKHHDGFCLFDSKYTAYNSVKQGPCRDIVGELTEAVRKDNMKMGLYYSGILDWTFANDPIYRNEDLFDNACPTFEYADYAYKQSMELIDRYHPSVFWNDIGWPVQSENALPHLLAHYYNTIPDGVVDDRFNGLFHDFVTKEYKQGNVSRSEKWEMCRGMGLSFGYNGEEGDDTILNVEDAILLLVSVVSENGNLLLNIGPKADGTIPEEQVKRLKEIGKWLSVNGDAIYGTQCSKRHAMSNADGTIAYFTSKHEDLYVFVDGAKDDCMELFLPDTFGTAIPLDKRINCKTEARRDGSLLKISNIRNVKYTLGFIIKGGE